jgi:hypothetical protein
MELRSGEEDPGYVKGAGGDISFARRGTEGDNSGNPIGKPIPVLEIPALADPPADPYVTAEGDPGPP